MPFDREWFRGLFGAEPYPQKSEEDLREDIKTANAQLVWAEARLEERLRWEYKRDGAMAAWRRAEEAAGEQYRQGIVERLVHKNWELAQKVEELEAQLAKLRSVREILDDRDRQEELARHYKAESEAKHSHAEFQAKAHAENMDLVVLDLLNRIVPGQWNLFEHGERARARLEELEAAEAKVEKLEAIARLCRTCQEAKKALLAGPLYIDAKAPAEGRRAHWAFVREGGVEGPVVLKVLLDNSLSTSGEPPTSQEEYDRTLALLERLAGAYNREVVVTSGR